MSTLGVKALGLIVLLSIALFAACAGDREAEIADDDAGRTEVYARDQTAPRESTDQLPADPLAAGTAEDLETLHIELEIYDARAAQLHDIVGDRGLARDGEVREALAQLAEYREQADERLAELGGETGDAFVALRDDVELMIADLDRNLDATARELEIELDAVERSASTSPLAKEEEDEEG